MSLLKDTTVTFGSRVITMGFKVGITSVAAWLLGPEGRGELAIYSTISLLLALSTSGGIEMAAAYYVGTKKHSLSDVLGSTGFIVGAATVLSVIVAYFLWLLEPEFIRKINGRGLIISVAHVPAILFFTSLWFLHSAKGYIVSYCVGLIISTGVAFFGILVLCWRTHMAEYAMLAYVLSTFLAAAYLLFILLRRNALKAPSNLWCCVKDLYKYGFKYYIGRVAEFFNVQIGLFILVFLGSTAQIGLFSAAVGLTTILAVVPEVLTAVLLSRVVKGQRDSIELMAKTVRVAFWVLLLASLFLGVFCRPIVRILLSPDFLGVVVPIWFLLPGTILRCCSKILSLYFNGVGRPEISSIALGVAVVVSVIMMFILLPVYGLVGVAIASTVGQVFSALVFIVFYKYSFKLPLSLLLPQVSDMSETFSLVYGRIRSRIRQ